MTAVAATGDDALLGYLPVLDKSSGLVLRFSGSSFCVSPKDKRKFEFKSVAKREKKNIPNTLLGTYCYILFMKFVKVNLLQLKNKVVMKYNKNL